MMRTLLIVAMATVLGLATNTKYRDILDDPEKLRTLYENLKAELDLNLGELEDRMRWEIFQENVAMVADENEVVDETAEFTVNKFSILSPEERSGWLSGFKNSTGYEAYLKTLSVYQPPITSKKRSTTELPEEWFWTDQNYVTEVQDQGWCGSCWVFAGVSVMETNYAIATGVLRKFSEQELLDCTYEGGKWDGCDGGWQSYTFDYVMRYGRLAPASDYPYTEVDSVCKTREYENAMIGATVAGYQTVEKTEEGHLSALLNNAVSVAYYVTDRFYTYERGIYKDVTSRCRAKGHVNHAVTMVGYGTDYYLVKNSWGRDWGDQGFVKFLRGYHNCGLLNYSIIPVFKATSVTDTSEGDTPTQYNPRHSEPSDDCVDERDDCELHLCFDETVSYEGCRRTCHTCDVDFEAEESDGECGNNLVRCDDGICRHRHICRWVPLIEEMWAGIEDAEGSEDSV